MKNFLETERLVVKLTDPSHFDDILALRADPEVQKYTMQEVYTKENVEKFLKIIIPYQEKHGHAMSSVFTKEDGAFIGQAGIFHIGHYDLQPEIEIGYRFHKIYWGNGYATEVSKALINWGFENLSLNEIIAFVETSNKASHRVVEKCAMHNLGLVQCHYGKLEKYVITRKEWELL